MWITQRFWTEPGKHESLKLEDHSSVTKVPMCKQFQGHLLNNSGKQTHLSFPCKKQLLLVTKREFPSYRHQQSRACFICFFGFKHSYPEWGKWLRHKECFIDTGMASLCGSLGDSSVALCTLGILFSCEYLQNTAPCDKNGLSPKCKLTFYLESDTSLFVKWPYNKIPLWQCGSYTWQ